MNFSEVPDDSTTSAVVITPSYDDMHNHVTEIRLVTVQRGKQEQLQLQQEQEQPNPQQQQQQQQQQQLECSLYMPSMYDTDEEDVDYNSKVDDRDDESRVSSKSSTSSSRYLLKRCLAWSVDEQDEERSVAPYSEGKRKPHGSNVYSSFRALPEDEYEENDTPSNSNMEDYEESAYHHRVTKIHWEEKLKSPTNFESLLLESAETFVDHRTLLLKSIPSM